MLNWNELWTVNLVPRASYIYSDIGTAIQKSEKIQNVLRARFIHCLAVQNKHEIKAILYNMIVTEYRTGLCKIKERITTKDLRLTYSCWAFLFPGLPLIIILKVSYKEEKKGLEERVWKRKSDYQRSYSKLFKNKSIKIFIARLF